MIDPTRPAPGRVCFLIAAAFLGSVAAAGADAPAKIEPPISPDGSAVVSLFCSEPDVVTPIGAAVDGQGRLLVVESHTHFRPNNYKGPPADRIQIFAPTAGDARADQISTFYEGPKYLMNIAIDRDGSVLASSRNEIFRLEKSQPPGEPPRKITLAHLETKQDYPHNGLHGLTLDRNDNICFAIGENFGGAWKLIGSDGATLTESTGSGAIFRMDGKGNGLVRLARGFWNPFALGVDPMNNLWALDNDPDGRPPCRLIQVLPGADYGFEMRYGRTGLHPLQSWDAELPGTQGMIAGVGEAPCAVVWHAGRLYVSSWRDHVIQSFTLKPRGASYEAALTPILTGGENFRPVGLAFAPDGTLYVTDWGSSSYSVNGKGRIWKVTFPHGAPAGAELVGNEANERAEHVRHSQDLAQLIATLDDPDPVIAQAAQFALAQLPASENIEWKSLASAPQRIGVLTALLWRNASVETLATAALADTDDRVRQMGVRAIAEQNLTSARAALQSLLAAQTLSPRLLGMTIATINQLDGDPAAKIDSRKINDVLLTRINAADATDASRATALHMLQAGHPAIPLPELRTSAHSNNAELQIEAIRYLNADADAGRFSVLEAIAQSPMNPDAVRAEAIVGLAANAPAEADLFLQAATTSSSVVRGEALRSLRSAGPSLTAAQKAQLSSLPAPSPADTDLLNRVLGVAPTHRPAETDIAAWQRLIDRAPGNPDAGRRIFFHPNGPGCYRCHMIEGRGRQIGPDLTMIGHAQTKEHVLTSILDPSREIAPLFTMWSIFKRNGERVDGMLLRRDGQSLEVYVDASGAETKVKESDVIDRRIRKESLMPTGLVQGMTDQELRDVIAFLVEKR